MIRIVALLSCVVLVLAGVKNPQYDRVGGPAEVGQFPYIVSIRYKTRTPTNGQDTHTCGGSILTSRHILTAAHCVYRYRKVPRKFFVVVGATLLSSGGQAHELENIICHSRYKSYNFENDIAILKTASDIIFNDLVQPIPLQTEEVPDRAEMIVSGWGYSSRARDRVYDNLQWTTQKHLMSLKKCSQLIPPGIMDEVFPTQICTYTIPGPVVYVRPGHGMCKGDSGGPLVYAEHLAGVASRGAFCSQKYPNIYTKVKSFVPWITGIINNKKM